MSTATAKVALVGALAAGISIRPASAEMKGNQNCPGEEVFFDPGNGEDVVLPQGYKIEVFAKGLNFPTGLAFVGDRENFRVLVVESGTGLPSKCNDNAGPGYGGKFSPTNPFTPDLLVFDKHGNKVAGPFGKPNAAGRPSYQADGPAIGLAFEKGTQGGMLFGTDSNQGVRGAPGQGNNTSRVVTIDMNNNTVNTFIGGLPTGDHPTELIIVKDGFIYWSQGSATNSGVTGHDNGAGGNQHDIACQDIKLSDNVFDSGDGDFTSGYSNHGVKRPNQVVPAFESATKPGMCTGAILRAPIHVSHPENHVQPFSWGYRNPFGLRFSPEDHALRGKLFVTENGEDERGARPTNNAPDRLQVAQMNADGTPDHHGWPDRFGFLDSTQAIFNPVGGPGDDLCGPTKGHPGNATTFPACKPVVAAEDSPVKHVLAFLPQPPIAPLALEPADVAVVGPDFAPNSFTSKVARRGAALVAREGDFGFSAGNGKPEEGHDIQLVNFSKPDQPLRVELERFAFNCKVADQGHDPNGSAACTNPQDQAFVSKTHGINRPLQVLFGPDEALYLVDFGAVRDFGQSDPESKFLVPGDGPLLQIPGTGVIWKISRTGAQGHDDDDD
jgi:glucose/arabinose dehydrogenase